MELPGGLIVNGQLCRSFNFKPLTGLLERIISESGFAKKSLAEQVSMILTHTLQKVAGLEVSEELVRALSSGDRLYLMMQLEAVFDPSEKWLTSHCQKCDELIQFQIKPSTMPVKPAGKNFPQTSLSLSIGDINLRVPTGADEEGIANFSDNQKNNLEFLLNRLISFSNKKLNVKALSTKDFSQIDKTLDEMSPQPADSVSIECPYCTHFQHLSIDNYAWISQATQTLDEEIHNIAINYHWSEKDILQLPKVRRQRYLKLIEQNNGKYQANDFIHAMQGEA